MGKRPVALAALLLLGCTAGPPAPPPEPPLRLRSVLNPTEATIYDPITVVVRVGYADGVVPELPDTPPVPEGLTLDDAQESGPDIAGDRRMLTRTYVMHATQPGSYIVPALAVAYTLPDGTQAEAKTPRMFVTVASLLAEGEPDLAALRPPKPPVAVPRDYTPVVRVAVAGLAGALIAGILVYLALRYWRREAAATAPPLVPPHEAALNALAHLERGPLLRQGRVREYMYGLSDVLCNYLEGRFGVAAVASTSEQLLHTVHAAQGLPRETTVLVKRFVAQADPIKFAHTDGAVPTAEAWTRDIRRYVEHTRPDPVLETAA